MKKFVCAVVVVALLPISAAAAQEWRSWFENVNPVSREVFADRTKTGEGFRIQNPAAAFQKEWKAAGVPVPDDPAKVPDWIRTDPDIRVVQCTPAILASLEIAGTDRGAVEFSDRRNRCYSDETLLYWRDIPLASLGCGNALRLKQQVAAPQPAPPPTRTPVLTDDDLFAALTGRYTASRWNSCDATLRSAHIYVFPLTPVSQELVHKPGHTWREIGNLLLAENTVGRLPRASGCVEMQITFHNAGNGSFSLDGRDYPNPGEIQVCSGHEVITFPSSLITAETWVEIQPRQEMFAPANESGFTTGAGEPGELEEFFHAGEDGVCNDFTTWGGFVTLSPQ